MTRLAFVADCHVANHKRWGGETVGGLNERGRECVNVIYRSSVVAKERGCEALFVLGDLFDGSRPTPPLVAATVKAMRAGPGETVVLLGNHDRQSMHPNDHACASMAQSGVLVVTTPIIKRYQDVEVGVIPYAVGEAKDWLAAGMAQLQEQWSSRGVAKHRLVVTHLGIWDDDTPAYMKAAQDAVGIGFVRWLCDAHKVDAFMAGNWHQARGWKSDSARGWPNVMIPGTLIPHSFSDPPEHGAVEIYDTGCTPPARTRIPLPTPLWWKVDALKDLGGTQSALRNHFSAREPCRAYVRLTVRQDELAQALEVKDGLVRQYGDGIVAEVQVREEEARAEVKEVARAALAAGRDDLAETYADLAKVEEPGTTAGVARRLGEYRKAAG